MRIPLVLLFIFYFSYSIQAQNQSQSSSTVNEFFHFLDDFIKDYNGNIGLKKNYSEEELFDFAKKYYKVIAEDPIGYNKYILNEYNEFTSRRRAGLNLNEMPPPLKRGIFLNLLKEKLGKEFTKIIGVPYFLRANIKEITYGIYISTTDSMKFGQTDLLCQIEDVIKGDNRFEAGDTIIVGFLDWWLKDPNKNFEVNKSYFIPLQPWKCNVNTCDEITLRLFPDNNYGIYPIVVNFIQTPGNYFGLGEISKWTDFKNHFTENYVDWFKLE
jgi:hypothetical protein